MEAGAAAPTDDPREIERTQPGVARFVDALLRWRRLVCLLLLAVTIPLLVVTAQRSSDQDNSLQVFFLPDDPAYQLYRRLSREFESDRVVIAAFRVDDVFSAQNLELVKRATNVFRKVRGIARVQSLTDVTFYRLVDDTLRIGPFVPEVPQDPAALEQIRSDALRHRLYPNNLISPDGTTTAIVGWLGVEDDMATKERITREVEQGLAGLGRPDVRFYLSGLPVNEHRYSTAAEADQNRLVPLTFGFAMATLFLIFRQLVPALIATCIQFMVFVMVVGLYLATGHQMNMIFGMIGPILIAACIGDSVYLITYYTRARARRIEARDALVVAVAAAWRPCLFSSLTTAAGLIAFSVSDMAPVRALGQYAALGSMLEYGVNFTLIPITLYALRGRSVKDVRHSAGSGPVIRSLVNGATTASLSYPRSTIALSLLASGVMMAGIRWVTLESDVTKDLPPQHELRQSIHFIEDHLTKVVTAELIFRGPPGTALDPQLLGGVQELQHELARDPTIGKTFSLVDYLLEVKRLFDPAGGDAVPRTREEAAQLTLMAEGSGDHEIRRFVNDDYSALRLNVRLPFIGSTRFGEIVDRIEHRARELVPGGVQIQPTGNWVLWRTIERNILTTQVESFSIAFVIIMLTLVVGFRSLRVPLLALLPNALPVLVTLGFMGYAGIPLGPATAMFASLGIGVAVDDTVQFVNRLREETRQSADLESAIRRTFAVVGGPIIFTSLIMVAGFGVLCLGVFLPMFHFGLLISVTLFVALLGDLLLLPALLFLGNAFRQGAPVAEVEVRPMSSVAP